MDQIAIIVGSVGWGLAALTFYLYTKVNKKLAVKQASEKGFLNEIAVLKKRIAALSNVDLDRVRVDEEGNIRID